jgi:undecaprenyl-diphosphatase
MEAIITPYRDTPYCRGMSHEIRWRIAGCAVAFLAAAFFAALAHAVTEGHAAAFDMSVRDAIHSWATPMFTEAMRVITVLGELAFLVPLGAIVVWRLCAAGRPRAGVLFLVVALGAEGCDQVLKFCFQRPRPAAFFGLKQPMTYSFPSGHSVASCCFYGVLAALLAAAAPSRARQVAIWMAAAWLILAIGFSRVYLGVHYPTDVLGGYAVAVVWVVLVRAGYEFWLRAKRE